MDLTCRHLDASTCRTWRRFRATIPLLDRVGPGFLHPQCPPPGPSADRSAAMIVPLTVLMVLLAVFAVEVAWLLAEP